MFHLTLARARMQRITTMLLKVVRLKPNPFGKDRTRVGSTAAQLGAEWIDIQNQGSAVLNLSGLDLYHLAYNSSGQSHWEKVLSLTGSLAPRASLRIHSGQNRDLSVLRPEDRVGAYLHTFTGSDAYVWNNREGDTALLWLPSSSTEIDKASYNPNPSEGTILSRSGSELVPEVARIGVRY
jgi:predicted extracellular nuclease